MNIVFYDYGGCHTSVVAANLYSGRIKDQLPSSQEFMALPYFDKTIPQDFGHLHNMGQDQQSNQVYTLGTKSSSYGYILAALTKLQDTQEHFTFISTMPWVNNVLRVGGFLSRSLNLPALGRPLVLMGIKLAYKPLQLMVQQTHTRLEG